MGLKILELDAQEDNKGYVHAVIFPRTLRDSLYPCMRVRACYEVHQNRVSLDEAGERGLPKVVVKMPSFSRHQYLLVSFAEEHLQRESTHLDMDDSRDKLARLIANLVSNTELARMDDDVPMVFRA